MSSKRGDLCVSEQMIIHLGINPNSGGIPLSERNLMVTIINWLVDIDIVKLKLLVEYLLIIMMGIIKRQTVIE